MPSALTETPPTAQATASAAPAERPGPAVPAQGLPVETPAMAAAMDRAVPAILPAGRANPADTVPARRSRPPASAGDRIAAASPVSPGEARPAAPARAPAEGPRLSIGRIEVTVLAEPRPGPAAPRRPEGDDAFLSKHYLRRL
ncbi:MAG: hypothetical protein KDG55_13300 [Rhodocyclaceae bacterium]|nr:hypothetical protein [Rhodocyclaceae bacterium]